MTKQARHMRNDVRKNKSGKGHIVALALAGVLALGGVGAICVTTIGRSPGQPTSAVTQTATAATKKAETKNNTNQAVTKANTKQTENKSNSQARPATNEAKPQQQRNNQQQQRNNQQQQQQNTQQQPATRSEAQNPDTKPVSKEEVERSWTPKYSADQCMQIACDYVGAGGQAKGPALNLRCSNLIDGGGTRYYKVNLDLGDVHYEVQVDALSGKVISGDATHMGTRNLLDDNGDIIEGTGVQVDA